MDVSALPPQGEGGPKGRMRTCAVTPSRGPSSKLYSPRASGAGPRRSPSASTFTARKRWPWAMVSTSPARSDRLGLSMGEREGPRERRMPPSSIVRAARVRVLKNLARQSQTSARQVSKASFKRLSLVRGWIDDGRSGGGRPRRERSAAPEARLGGLGRLDPGEAEVAQDRVRLPGRPADRRKQRR